MSAQRCTLQCPMDGIQRWASVVLTAGAWLAQRCNTMMAKRWYNVVNNVFPSITPCCKHKKRHSVMVKDLFIKKYKVSG